MKFSLIGPVYPYRGGIAHFTTSLYLELENQGHPTQLISFRRQFPLWLYPGESDKDPSQHPIRIDADFILDPLYPWTWNKCIRDVAYFQPDLVVIQWWTTFWAIPYFWISKHLKRKGIKTTFLIHNVMPHEAKFWDKALTKLALGTSEVFITQTQIQKKRLLEILPDSDVQVCLQPTYSLFLKGKMPREKARKQLNLPSGAPILLFFGIVRPYKGVNILIDALALIKDIPHPPYLIIAGEFWETKEKYEKQILKHKLDERVVIFDHYLPDDEVSVLFSASDVLVAPYTGGTQSAAALSALGFGLPLIVTQPVAEGIDAKYNESMIVVPPGNAKALADAIQDFLTHYDPKADTEIPVENDWQRFVYILEDIAK